MAIELGAAYISILPSTDKLAPAIRRELGMIENQARRAGDRSGQQFGSRFSASLGKWTKRGLLAGATGVGLLGAAGLKTAADLEQSQIGFETMLGSADRANRFLAKIKKTAAQTPFELRGLTQASQKMLAFGFAAKDVIPNLTILGDASAGLGLGAEGINRLVIALGQIKAKGRVQGDEILQLTESGIPAQRILRNELGLTAKEYDKMQRKGEITADKAIPALLRGIKDGSKGVAGETAKFGGLMEKQSQSLTGLFSTLKDTVFVGIADGIKPLLPLIKEGLASAIENVGPGLAKAGKGLAVFVQGAKDGTGAGGEFASTLETIWDVTKPVIETVGSLIKTFTGLPDSTKKVLLLAGAIYLLNNRLGGSLPSFQNFSAQAVVARTKTLAMRGALLGAGIAMSELASKSGNSHSALGDVLTVGGQMATGFAVAGPLGLAIGGVTGLLSVFAGQSKEAAQEQAGLDTSADRIADTLDRQSGALTRLTRATAAKELADNGALTAAKAMGISLDDVLDAALGNTGALYKVSGASEAWANTLAKNGKYTEKEEGHLQKLRDAISTTSGKISDQRDKILLVNEAMGKAKNKAVTFSVRTPGLGGALAGIATLGDSITRAIEKSKRLKIGENAKGTDNWRGGLTWVGEKGPELINLAKGAQVIPNHRLSAVGKATTATGPSATTTASAAPTSFPSHLTLRVGEEEFEAYVSGIAEDTYNGETEFAGTQRRMK